MRFLLLDRDEQYIGPLKQVISARNREVLNGENVLTISTLQHVEKNYRILYKDECGDWQEFIIRGIDEEKIEDGIKYSVFAESSFYETLGDYIEDKRAYKTTANVALAKALEPTRWEVGIVDDLGLGTVNFYHISAKEAVQRIISVWKCELRTRVTVSGNTITHRYVDLLARRGADRGKRFTYTKNLINVTKMVHREDVITALYGYGRGQELYGEDGEATGGYGRRLTFGEINNGLNYVANETAREIWGRNNQNGTKSHVFGKVEFDDCDNQVELLNRTLERLEEVSKPLITYKTRVLGENVSLGDDVSVIDKDFVPELRLKARVIELDRDLLNKRNSDILLGNFIPAIQDEWHRQVEFINNFRSKQGVWDRSQIIGQDGTINAQYLEDLINEINRRMNAQGGYVYISETGDGLITYDTPNPEDATMAIQLLGGSFRIANSKLPNGEWNWRTFGDGNGFIADAFIGGLLKGGKVHFDLTNGTLLIGDSIEDYRLLFDGNNLNIRLSHGKTIEESIDEIEIGGRNLFLYDTYLRPTNTYVTSEKVDNYHVKVFHNNPDADGNFSWSGGWFYIINNYPFEAGKYTVSFKARLMEQGMYEPQYRVQLMKNDSSQLEVIGTESVSVDFQKHSFTFEVSVAEELQIIICLNTNDIEFSEIKLEKGNKATDWTPAPEDIDQNISDSQEYLRGEIDEVNAKVDNVIGLVGEEPVANIKQQLQDAFERELEAINKALYGDEGDEGEEGILERLAALSGDTAGLYIDLADQAALIESLTGKISIEGDTVLIGDAQASKGIRIKPDEIAFLEGESKVAWITGGMLYIDAGVFLTRLKIGNHVFQSVDGNPDITIVGYEP